MALTGELSDLSLSELIEFFCNQRKTGRLKVIYPHLPGYFYIQAGALIDARIGSLTGIDAVYYALTLPNASFKFDTDFEFEQRTINQPWTQVVLEGLRRMDEGIEPEQPIKKEELPDENDLEQAIESVITRAEQEEEEEEEEESSPRAPMAMTVDTLAAPARSRRMILAVMAVVVLIVVTATALLANSYARADVTASIPPLALHDLAESSSDTSNGDANEVASSEPTDGQTSDQVGGESGAAAGVDTAAQMRGEREREARERERRKAEAERANAWPAKTSPDAPTPTATPSAVNTVKKADGPKAGPKMVTVQVTYDEAGRVTQASGSDPTALRIARQKRFPSGKAGSTTVTIPIN
ncbi:MAG TPA: DUF4388 domain-containing protein [Pyrinomonadaceae bacterium]|jgi:hypothetical protein|nr:DUF4388 domain-containing protein [Pyrinomonadaceae bacterium]